MNVAQGYLYLNDALPHASSQLINDFPARVVTHYPYLCTPPPFASSFFQAGMILAEIPNVTVATDGILCARQSPAGGPGGGLLTEGLRVWNFSGRQLVSDACGGDDSEVRSGDNSEVHSEQSVDGRVLFLLRKYGHQV